ncbi:hypothetical protein K461DRAFT_296595 [Myriangium duriaei CBS 260.36]|uniref:Rhodopsin domain-containing protein n=1 Tax=Myriangium duriaei CBS 260.36 TaxID=1168546 RepID=A0A9P4MJX3_9PEZI|nr:hypothetical protein K461DRAFT_296595 [Myriangium duriaei CBS 260.36]
MDIIKNEVHSLVTTFIGFEAITIPILLLRLWTRGVILRKVGADDYAILAAWIIFTATFAITSEIPSMVDDLMHGRVTSFNNLEMTIKAIIILYLIAMALIKISLGAFFFRIFTVVHVRQRVMIAVLVIITALWSIVLAIISAVTCGATSGLLGAGNSCGIWMIYGRLSLAWSVFNTFGDLFFAVLSIITLWNIQMTRQTKLLTCFILVLGTLGGVASFIRAYIMAFAETNIQQDFATGRWSVVEMGMGLLAPSLACLHPLATKIFGPMRAVTIPTEGRAYSAGTAESHASEGRLRLVSVVSNMLKGGKAPTINTIYIGDPLAPRGHSDAV